MSDQEKIDTTTKMIEMPEGWTHRLDSGLASAAVEPFSKQRRAIQQRHCRTSKW